MAYDVKYRHAPFTRLFAGPLLHCPANLCLARHMRCEPSSELTLNKNSPSQRIRNLGLTHTSNDYEINVEYENLLKIKYFLKDNHYLCRIVRFKIE